jgi:RNA polymerase sigma factor (sigma-70 family)
MPPPPAEPFAARIFLGPALRAQPDSRLVKLVREGYDGAFEEIVRRYRRQLDRFAAAFVGNRSEDVTQDAFSKALLALRGSEKEIELRPWLYRIVRNTALNDLRDGPPPTAELGETAATGPSAAVEAERREELAELMARLRALPEPQRAAIVMRELEGLSHEEIAAALGLSGGGARQAIYRARATLRGGLGLLLPLPLLRMLFDHGGEAAAGGAVAAAGAGTAAGGGAALGGIGAAGALKVGLATAVLAGSVGAGVAIEHDRDPGRGQTTVESATIADREAGNGVAGGPGAVSGPGSGSGLAGDDRGRGGSGGDDRGDGEPRHGDRGSRPAGGDDSNNHGGGPGPSGDDDGHGSGRSGRSGRGSGSGGGDDSHSGSDDSGPGHGSGGSGSGSSGKGDGGDDGSASSGSKDGSGSGGGSSHSGSDGSGSGKSGSGGSDHGGEVAPIVTAPPPEPVPEEPSGSGGDSGSSSGGDSGSSGGSGSAGSGSSGGSGGSSDDS